MKRVLIIVVLFLSAGLSSRAQDIITTRSGDSIKAKVLEVSQSEVRYKRFSSPDGPTFTLKPDEIVAIIYENGETDVFSGENTSSSRNASASVSPGMPYRQIKRIYSPKNYIHDESDSYSPFWSGVASFFVPGLGQGICGEWGRGLGILAGQLGCVTLSYVGINAGAKQSDAGKSPDVPYSIALAALIGTLGIEIWNVFDAAKVAKVKNMYEQDLRALTATVNISLEPFLAYSQCCSDGGSQPVTGLSLKMRF